MEYKDYYQILGVDRQASQEEIKTVYRKLTRKYHPDISKEPDAEAKAKAINEAYDVIGDPEKRRAYDEMGQNWQNTGFQGASGMDFRDLFEQIFRQRQSGGFRGHGNFGDFADFSAQKTREEASFSLEIDLEDSYFGRNKSIAFMEGNKRRELNVNIPKGIQEGQKLRVKTDSGIPILLEIHFRPHPRFRLEGKDLHLNLAITPWEATLGSKIPLHTLGDSVEVKIPKDSQSGKKMRLKGLGLPESRKSEAGDLYLHLHIVTPPADTPKAEAYYQEMAEFFANFSPR